MVQFQRKRKKSSGVELTPLIDVVFLLLVFLILTSNFQQPTLQLDLPTGTSDDSKPERAVILEVTAEGILRIDGNEVAADSLDAELVAALEGLEKPVVRLRADRETSYGTVMPVIEAARRAGAIAVDLVHQGETR